MRPGAGSKTAKQHKESPSSLSPLLSSCSLPLLLSSSPPLLSSSVAVCSHFKIVEPCTKPKIVFLSHCLCLFLSLCLSLCLSLSLSVSLCLSLSLSVSFCLSCLFSVAQMQTAACFVNVPRSFTLKLSIRRSLFHLPFVSLPRL